MVKPARRKKKKSSPCTPTAGGKKALKRRNTGARNKNVALEIEEALQEQRRQQALSSPTDNKAKIKRELGGYVYDEEKRAYFPQGHTSTQTWKSKNERPLCFPRARKKSFPYEILSSRTMPASMKGTSSHSFDNLFAAQMCHFPGSRRRLVADILGETLLRQDWNIKKWRRYTMDCPFEPLAPWFRTFDVAEVCTGNTKHPVFLFCNGSSPIELSCHWGALDISHTHNARFLPDKDGDGNIVVGFPSGLRHLDDSWLTIVDLDCLDALRRDDRRWLQLSDPAHSEYESSSKLPVDANDVIRLPHSKKLMIAADYEDSFRGLYFRSLCGASQGPGDPNNVIISDALTLTSLCPQQHSDIAVVGYRNGQCGIYDARDRFLVGATTADPQNLRNVLQLHSFSSNPFHFIAQGSGRSYCRLYDMRRQSSKKVDASAAELYSDSALVHDFALPSSAMELGKRFSRGVTTVLGGTLVLAPYVSEAKCGMLGVWSMFSGQFLGAKQLTSDPIIGVEMCPTITTGWDPPSDNDERRDDTPPLPVPDKGSLWVRCWDQASSKMFNIALSEFSPFIDKHA